MRRVRNSPSAPFCWAAFSEYYSEPSLSTSVCAPDSLSPRRSPSLFSLSACLRALGRASILENNIVQTTGNAGQSIAAGVIFTLPALIFLGFDLEYARIFILALLGGWLGVLFMIPLRRQLIVEEHGNLTYPEGTACADVLIAGERGGSFASRVFFGLGLGALYTLFQNENLLGAWPGTPNYEPKWLPGAALRAEATPEYLGVGYIIGPRVAGVLFAGGVFSWFVLMPAIHFFGAHLPSLFIPALCPSHRCLPAICGEPMCDPWAPALSRHPDSSLSSRRSPQSSVRSPQA